MVSGLDNNSVTKLAAMTPTITTYYHADCLDGFGAAYAAWRVFGERAVYRPMYYDQPWNADEVAGKDVFILDFSFPAEELYAMAGLAHSVFLLDHHETARQLWAERLQDGSDGLDCYRDPELPLSVAFNLGKSGARLAWEYFHPEAPLPLAIAHIEDQDLWRFGIPGSRAYCRALRLQSFDFETWDVIVRSTTSASSERYRSMMGQGEAIEGFCTLEVERLASSGLVMAVTLKGAPIDPPPAISHGQPVIDEGDRSCPAISGFAINASALFASDLGHQLAHRSGTFGLIWQLGGDGDVKVSLRADGQMNVAMLAERYGGGGHPNAAGFRMSASRFFAEVLKL